jgi:uncharacterized protein (DUF433 family)
MLIFQEPAWKKNDGCRRLFQTQFEFACLAWFAVKTFLCLIRVQSAADCFAAFHNLPVRIGLCYLAAMKAKSVVVVDPEIMSGTPCFAGTRVPARTLIDHLEAGDSLDVFLEDFPTVTRKQAIAFLEEASERMLVAA